MRCVSSSQRLRLFVAASMLPFAACGGATTSESAPGSTRPTAPGSVSSSVTLAATTSPDPEVTCADGEYPAVGAVDLANGEVSWVVCSSAEVWRSLVGATDKVVVVSEAGDYPEAQTVGFSAADGTELWRRPTTAGMGDIPRGPVAGAGVVVRVDETGTGLVGLDVLTGDEVWSKDVAAQPLGQGETVTVVADTEPVDGQPSGIRGLDRATGAEVWSSDIWFGDSSGTGVARGPAAVWDDKIAVPTSDTLTAVDMATGATLWTAPQTDHPEAVDGVVVGSTPASGPTRSIRALDAANGDVLWEAPGQSSYGDLLAVGDGIVAVSDGSEIVAYELRTGAERWRRAAEGPAQPQLIAGTTLISLWEATLSAISTSDGSTLWTATQPLGSPLMNNVSALETTLYIAVNSRQWGD